MKDLSEIRCDIDAIDRQIVSLYEQRMGLAAEVAEYKIANHKNVYDKAREDDKLKTLAGLVPDEFLKQGVVELFEQIMSTSRKKQYQMLAEQDRSSRWDFGRSMLWMPRISGSFIRESKGLMPRWQCNSSLARNVRVRQ